MVYNQGYQPFMHLSKHSSWFLIEEISSWHVILSEALYLVYDQGYQLFITSVKPLYLVPDWGDLLATWNFNKSDSDHQKILYIWSDIFILKHKLKYIKKFTFLDVEHSSRYHLQILQCLLTNKLHLVSLLLFDIGFPSLHPIF